MIRCTAAGASCPPARALRSIQALDEFKRQALHAERLVFTHPKSGKRVEFTAKIPSDLAGLLGVLDKDMREAAR